MHKGNGHPLKLHTCGTGKVLAPYLQNMHVQCSHCGVVGQDFGGGAGGAFVAISTFG